MTKKRMILVSLKVSWDGTANFSVFEWNPSSTGFSGFVNSLDSVTRVFSMSLISTRF